MESNYKITSDGYLEFRIKLPESGSLLEQEEAIQAAVNEAGSIMNQHVIESLDTDGTPIELNGNRYYSKGKQKKNTKRASEK